MRNRFAGKCNLCGKDVAPKKGRWHVVGYTTHGRNAQEFEGLRCIPCSTTTKRGKKLTAERLSKVEILQSSIENNE